MAGDWYDFRVSAHNVHGWSVVSALKSIQAAQAPDSPAAATTTIVDKSIRIYWTQPSWNFKTITAYQVLIQDHLGSTFSEELTHCDGSTSGILTSLYCDIPVSVLRSSPFNLILADPVVAKVRAYNERGWSSYSTLNVDPNIAYIQTEPGTMNTPQRGSSTSIDRIEVTWAALASPNNGNSPITTYALYWDAGTGGTSWTDLAGLDSDYLSTSFLVTTGITMGQTY